MATFDHKAYFSTPVTGEPTHTVTRLTKMQTFTLTANADEVRVMRLPRYAKILDCAVIHGAFDSGSAVRGKLVITDGTTSVEPLTGLNISSAGVKRTEPLTADPAAWLGKLFKAETDVKLVITTAATGWQAAALAVQVIYTQDLEDGQRADAI